MTGGDGITLTLDKSEFDRTLQRLLQGVEDFGPVAPLISEMLTNSVRRNFKKGGRPVRWPASKRADGDAAYGKKSGQTLVDTSRLLNSIIGGQSGESTIRVGTNVKYAAAHNFGVDKQISQAVSEHTRRITQAFGKEIPMQEIRVKSHKRSIHMKLPKREFMLIQNEDWDDIEDLLTDNIQQLIQGD